VIYKVLTVKRRGGKGKAKRSNFVVRTNASPAQAAGSGARRGERTARQAQTSNWVWSGQNNCSNLTMGARFDQPNGSSAEVGINWQGQASCTDGTTAAFSYAPPQVPSKRFPVSGGISYTFAGQYQNEGYGYRMTEGFNVSGQLFDNGGTANGSAGGSLTGPALPNKACSATAPSGLSRVQ
jgi:hypothetical protein